ncbi:uncharacterized protein JCM10292_007087 [Rhodotorula paludigena]|uniref:uncharacterized protein n=1 Tax=Rhodotorula paludigena TaxID=86838 RepID=UPI00317FBF9E
MASDEAALLLLDCSFPATCLNLDSLSPTQLAVVPLRSDDVDPLVQLRAYYEFLLRRDEHEQGFDAGSPDPLFDVPLNFPIPADLSVLSATQLLLLQFNPRCTTHADVAQAAALFFRRADEAKAAVLAPVSHEPEALATLQLQRYWVEWEGGERSEAGGLALRVEDGGLTVARADERLFTLEAGHMSSLSYLTGVEVGLGSVDCTLVIALARLALSPSQSVGPAAVQLELGSLDVSDSSLILLRAKVAEWSQITASSAASTPAPTTPAPVTPAPPTPAPPTPTSSLAAQTSAPPASPPRSRLPSRLRTTSRPASPAPPTTPVRSSPARVPLFSPPSPSPPPAATHPASHLPNLRFSLSGGEAHALAAASAPLALHSSTPPPRHPPHISSSSSPRQIASPSKRPSSPDRSRASSAPRKRARSSAVARHPAWDFVGERAVEVEWNPGFYTRLFALLRAIAPSEDLSSPVFSAEEAAILSRAPEPDRLPVLPEWIEEWHVGVAHAPRERLALERIYRHAHKLDLAVERHVLLSSEYPALQSYARLVAKVIQTRDALREASDVVLRRKLYPHRNDPRSYDPIDKLVVLVEQLRDNPAW